MDSITHALYKAIATEDNRQREIETVRQSINSAAADAISFAGLKPLGTRPHTHQAYLGAADTDLHISLEPCYELLALQLEFIAAGYNPPAALYRDGADVIISPGRIDLYAPTDDGNGSWAAMLVAKDDKDGRGPRDRRAVWQEETV